MKSLSALFLALALLLFFKTAAGLTPSEPALGTGFDSVALISSEARDSDGADVPGYCNATVLSAQVLITAAHCVQDAEFLKSFSVQVELGAYKYITKADGTLVRIGYAGKSKQTIAAAFYFTPSAKQKIQAQGLRAQMAPNEDIAVILLATPLSVANDFPFATLVLQSEFAPVKNNIAAYSPMAVTVNPFAEISTNDTKRQALLSQVTWNANSNFESRSSSRLDEGDSGGPLFVRIGSSWKLIAVVKGLAQTAFSSWDVFTATGANVCLIAPQLPASDQKLMGCAQ